MCKKAIDSVMASPGLKIMNHVIAGYPSPDLSRECIKTMEAAESDMIEIQIPFSDPMADGPTIVKANHSALDQGMTLDALWNWLKQVRQETKLPLLIMTYYNIPFRMGLEKFFSKAVDTGISGIILPDIPFDNEVENYPARIASYDLHPIQVISPSVNEKRLHSLSCWGSGFVYTTLKVGITGSSKSLDQGIGFLEKVRKIFPLPIAAGFGIDDPNQAAALAGKADMAVVGSHVIRLLDEEILQTPTPTLSSIYDFIKACKKFSQQ